MASGSIDRKLFKYLIMFCKYIYIKYFNRYEN